MSNWAERFGLNERRGSDATAADVLRLAHAIIRRGGWCPDKTALNPRGEAVAVLADNAWSFSIGAAIGRARYELNASWLTGLRAAAMFAAANGVALTQGRADLSAWESAPGRSGPDIDNAFEAALWRAEQPNPNAKGVLLDAIA